MADRHLQIVPEVAHSLHDEKPDIFIAAMTDMVDQYSTPLVDGAGP